MTDEQAVQPQPPSLTPASSTKPAIIIMGLGLLVGLAAGLVVFVGVPDWAVGLGGAAAGPTSTPAPVPVAGAPAPDFTLTDLDGNEVRLSDLHGKVVLVNFWATWCGPCRLEMPAIEAEYQARKAQGLTVLAVDLDEPVEDVADFVAELALSFPVLLDPGAQVFDLYRIRGYPTSFFIGRDGTIARQHVGYMNADQLAAYLDQLGLGE
jgi:peroxiredoxin